MSIRREPFVYWTPERYNDPGLSSSTWAAETTRDVNASCLRCGNHDFRRDDCNKGRIGKQGFCRMLFWHWGLYTDKNNKSRARHAHGQLLQPRWDGKKDPPVHTVPPHEGLPALEQNHPFHFKMATGVMMGTRCNHDLGV